MAPSMVPFYVSMYYEGTSARLSTDSTLDNKPALSIGLTNGDKGCCVIHEGILDFIVIRLNPTNAVTWEFEVYQDYAGANNSYQLRGDRLFLTSDNHINDVAAGADNIRYEWHGIDRPFRLVVPGNFYYNIAWSGAPGNTTGVIGLGGRRLSHGQ